MAGKGSGGFHGPSQREVNQARGQIGKQRGVQDGRSGSGARQPSQPIGKPQAPAPKAPAKIAPPSESINDALNQRAAGRKMLGNENPLPPKPKPEDPGTAKTSPGKDGLNNGAKTPPVTGGKSKPEDPGTTPKAKPEDPGTPKADPSEAAKLRDNMSVTKFGHAMSGIGDRIFGGKLGSKKSSIRITVVIVLIILSALGSLISIPLKLLHIANVVKNFHFNPGKHIARMAERRMLMIAFSVQIDGKNGGRRSATGNYLKDTFTNIRIAKFTKLLAAEGITMEFDKTTGKFLGLEKDGKRYGQEMRNKSLFETRAAIGELVVERLAPHRYLQHSLYTKAMRVHAGATFKFWAKDKIVGTIKEKLFLKVRGGIAGEAGINQGKSGGYVKPPPDPSDKEATAKYNAEKAAAGEAVTQASDAAKKQWEVFQKTKDIVAAHKAGIHEFRIRAAKSLGWTGLAMFYCLIKMLVDDAENKGQIEKADYLIRQANVLQTAKDQAGAGDVLGAEFGEFMTVFDGDGNANPATEEDAKDFTQAASWKRATGQPVNSDPSDKNYANFNPDLNEAANPDGKAMRGILGSLAQIFQIPGSTAVCNVLFSWVGWTIMGIEVVAALLDGETTTLMAGVIKTALIIWAVVTIVPKLLDAATGLAITGTENPVNWINNADAGTKLSAQNWNRINGDRAATDDEAAAIANAVDAEERAIAREKGWVYRTFDIANTRSIAARLLEYIPASPSGFIANVRLSLISMPRNFATIFFPARLALAADDQRAKDPYNFRSYVTTDAELENIDPLELEEILNQKLKGGQTRLNMLGDPTKYTPEDGKASGQLTKHYALDLGLFSSPPAAPVDLLHCFVDVYRPTNQPDDICLDMGFLTKNDKEVPDNPGKAQIIDKIYCEKNDICGLPWTHQIKRTCDTDIFQKCGTLTITEFDLYRIYLKYVLMTRSLEGMTTDTDPFAGSGVAAGPSGLVNTSDAKSLAAAILANPNITYGPGCDPAFGCRPDLVKGDLEKTVRGEKIQTVNTNNKPIELSASLLNILYQAGLKYKIQVDSFSTTHAYDQYNHPLGKAMDIWKINGFRAGSHVNEALDAEFSYYIAKFIPAGGEILQANECFSAPNLPKSPTLHQGADTCDHIHVGPGKNAK